MKTNILALTISIFMAGIVLTSCGEKSKQDKNNVKEDVKELNKDLMEGAIDTSEEIKIAVTEEWNKFKTASENTIQNTEKEIGNLREKITKANKKEKERLTKTLDKLEQKNKELKEKLSVRTTKFKENMIEYTDEFKANEKEFEREFSHDMDELRKSLNDLFTDNVN